MMMICLRKEIERVNRKLNRKLCRRRGRAKVVLWAEGQKPVKQLGNLLSAFMLLALLKS